MPRHKWREEFRWTLRGTSIDMVFGWSEHTRNPQHQYTVHMEQWDSHCLVRIDIPCRFNWWPLQENLRSENGWVNSALQAYWEENLHKGRTVKVRGDGPLIASPSVAKRRAEIAAADAERRAAEKQRHDAACADLAEKAAKGRAEFYSALPLATAYVGFEGRKPIVKVEGQGPTALVTLEGREPIEAKWLEAGGVKSLRFE